MKNTFYYDNLGLTPTQLYCKSLTISYKKNNKQDLCQTSMPKTRNLRVKLGTFTQWDIHGLLMSFTHNKCKQH